MEGAIPYAAFLALPLFLPDTGLAPLFCIGVASLISHCLGNDDDKKALKTSAFRIWSAGLAAFLYSLIKFRFYLHKIMP